MLKVYWKHIFVGFQLTVSKINVLFWEKAFLHTTTLMHRIWPSTTNQGNDSEMTFVAGASKINLKYLKTYNQLHNILRLFDVWPNFPFTINEAIKKVKKVFKFYRMIA